MESVPVAKPRHKAEAAEPQKNPVVTASFYIPRPEYRRLKTIAAGKGLNLQDIFRQGVNMWLEDNQEAPIIFKDVTDEGE